MSLYHLLEPVEYVVIISTVYRIFLCNQELASISCCFIFNCRFVTRQAKTRATAINSVASMNDAPGKRQARYGPMKLANVGVKSPGPIRPVIPIMLLFAPWSCP